MITPFNVDLGVIKEGFRAQVFHDIVLKLDPSHKKAYIIALDSKPLQYVYHDSF